MLVVGASGVVGRLEDCPQFAGLVVQKTQLRTDSDVALDEHPQPVLGPQIAAPGFAVPPLVDSWRRLVQAPIHRDPGRISGIGASKL